MTFRTDYEYQCEYTPTICDGPVFRWGTTFEISASRNGVMISGHSFCMKEPGVERLVNLIRLAESVHRQLAKNDRPDGLWFGEEYVAASQWRRAA